jgi:CarboxypepD_reg-like domain/TonB-dependent Receptor Plug Domain
VQKKISLILFFIFLIPFTASHSTDKQTNHRIPNNHRIINSTDQTGGIKGVIFDEKNNTLFSANVIVIGTDIGTTTNFEGKFRIENIPVGKYKIQVTFVGYSKATLDIEITENRFLQVNLILKPESFMVGGITVTAKEDLIPRDVATRTDINSGEIEHYQATNLGDILDLVPGIQKDANPGINKTSQVAIRGASYINFIELDGFNSSAFGTKIIIDGEPISNNANLQFEALTGTKFGIPNIGGGVDLREIPADNLESVSVIAGMPSVRYGDFSSGIIVLKTKMGQAPHRIKIKHNPKILEANFGGGFKIGNDALNYNLNFARSQRDLRLVGDEYTRATTQFIYSTLHNKNWKANYKLKSQFIYDEEEPKGDFRKTKNYNRGYTLGFNTWGDFNLFNEISKFTYNAYISMKNINSQKSKLVNEPVYTEVDTAFSYIGTLENKGIQWTAGGRLEWHNTVYTGDYIHNILAGTEIQFDANTGEGLIFDTLYTYFGQESVKRPYSFDSIPNQLILSLYVEDKITGNFLFDFSFMFGFRYEMYRPHSLSINGLWGDGDFVNSYQGSFFNPHVSLLVYLSSKNQLRINAGSSSKSPPMSLIYPPESILKIGKPIDYFRVNSTVPELQGYKTTQFEISYDQKLFSVLGISLSAYYNSRDKQPKRQVVPMLFESSNNGKKIVFISDQFYTTQNIGARVDKGVELSIKTTTIKPLNMNFKVTGSVGYNEVQSSGYNYTIKNDTSKGQFPNYQFTNGENNTFIGFLYPQSGKWVERIQLNYYLKYMNKTLGLWVTLRAEQLLCESKQEYNLIPVEYNLLTEQGKIERDYDKSIITKPSKWLFSFNVSKSLFNGAELSFFVNNFLDNPAIMRYYLPVDNHVHEESRNPELFYGIEFSMIFDKIL